MTTHIIRTEPRASTKRKTIVVGVCFLVVVVLYASLSTLPMGADPGWYDSLEKAPWQPPDWVFGVIWPLNFLAIAVVGVLLARADAARAVKVLGVLAVSVVGSLGWSYLFYAPHALAASAVSLAVAAVLTWVVLGMTSRIIGGWALLLLPYAIWVSLATTLAVWFAVSA